MDNIGEPYVTTRPAEGFDDDDRDAVEEASGLGLGFFIAKTLLERSGATVSLANRADTRSGAIVRVSWPKTFVLNR
jgi:two-component system sensor histidine kinase RegB